VAMKDTISWSCKIIIFPLLPFIIGALIRFFASGFFSFEILDGSELSFSMAICYVLFRDNITQITDIQSQKSLNAFSTIIVFVFLVMFAISNWIKIELQTEMTASIAKLKELAKSGPVQPEVLIQALSEIHENKFSKTLDLIKNTAATFTLLAIFVAIIIRGRFKLGD
jgi:hypothetical protein